MKRGLSGLYEKGSNMSYENYLQFQEINDSKDLNKDRLRIVFEIYWNILYNSIEINDFQLAYNMLYFIDEVINEMKVA